MPQQAWSDRRERQYEHILESERQQGRSPKRAKDIAARTVNKERARGGETKGRSSRTSIRDLSSGRRGGLRSGTRRPKGRTKEQLYNEAKRLDVPGRSRMNKQQLQRAVDASKR
jgi:plasmid stabilization system protein ParE